MGSIKNTYIDLHVRMSLSDLSLVFYGVQVLSYDTFSDFVLAISCRILLYIGLFISRDSYNFFCLNASGPLVHDDQGGNQGGNEMYLIRFLTTLQALPQLVSSAAELRVILICLSAAAINFCFKSLLLL